MGQRISDVPTLPWLENVICVCQTKRPPRTGTFSFVYDIVSSQHRVWLQSRSLVDGE